MSNPETGQPAATGPDNVPRLTIDAVVQNADLWGYGKSTISELLRYLRWEQAKGTDQYFQPDSTCLYPNAIQDLLDTSFQMRMKSGWGGSRRSPGRTFLMLAIGYHYAEDTFLPPFNPPDLAKAKTNGQPPLLNDTQVEEYSEALQVTRGCGERLLAVESLRQLLERRREQESQWQGLSSVVVAEQEYLPGHVDELPLNDFVRVVNQISATSNAMKILSLKAAFTSYKLAKALRKQRLALNYKID